MSNDPPVTALVTLAASGDQRAWDALVERYAPLIWSDLPPVPAGLRRRR